jgi:hypothetical protein
MPGVQVGDRPLLGSIPLDGRGSKRYVEREASLDKITKEVLDGLT